LEKERVGSVPVSDLCQRAGVKKEFGVDVCVCVCVWLWRKKTESFISYPKQPAAENQVPGDTAAGHITIIDNASTSQRASQYRKKVGLSTRLLGKHLKDYRHGNRTSSHLERICLEEKG